MADKHPECSPSAAMYLNEYTNPLLIIYFVTPIGVSSNDNVSAEGKFKIKLSEQEKKYQYLVGYAIGFPEKEGEQAEAIEYTVNTKVNYYDKIHDEDEQEATEE